MNILNIFFVTKNDYMNFWKHFFVTKNYFNQTPNKFKYKLVGTAKKKSGGFLTHWGKFFWIRVEFEFYLLKKN